MAQFLLRNFLTFCIIIIIITDIVVDSEGMIIHNGSVEYQQETMGIMCKRPDSNANSQNNIAEQWSPAGTKVFYTCDAGYYMFGQDIRNCVPTGQWSGEAPFCMKRVSYGKNVSCTGVISEQLPINSNFLVLVDDKQETCAELPIITQDDVYITLDLLENYSGIRTFHFVFQGISSELPVDKVYLQAEYGTSTELKPSECNIMHNKHADGRYHELWIHPKVAQSARYVSLKLKPTSHKHLFCEAEVYSEKAPSVHQCYDINNLDDTQKTRNNIKGTMTYRGNCYTFDGQSEPWDAANKHCQGINGGKLAHDVSLDTNSALINFMKAQNYLNVFWLGGQMVEKPGIKGTFYEWQWNSGQYIDKQLWDSNQQTNNKCLGIHAPNGLWLNFQCHAVIGSICQTGVQRCGSPDINIGIQIIDHINVTVGAYVTYGCFKDYVLIGDAKRQCLPSGTWSGRSPQCIHKDAVSQTGAMEMPEGAIIGIIIAGIVIGLLIIIIVITLVIIKRRGSFKQTIQFKKEPHGESAEVLEQTNKKEKERLSSIESQNYQSVSPDQQQTAVH